MWYFRRIVGKSMLPAYRPGQTVLVFNKSHFVVGDVVVAYVKKREIIKRVTKVKKNYYFLEGDNKDASTDSRDFGWVMDKYIEGKVVWPKRKKNIK